MFEASRTKTVSPSVNIMVVHESRYIDVLRNYSTAATIIMSKETNIMLPLNRYTGFKATLEKKIYLYLDIKVYQYETVGCNYWACNYANYDNSFKI